MLDRLISEQITWHCGGNSDPFQPAESFYGVTKNLIDITTPYHVSILFSTKSDTIYDANIRPDLHTFQLSFSNAFDNKALEPNVPNFEKRYQLYKDLKKDGFRVGIRLQPFIPGITTLDLVKMFADADNFSLEGIKMVPQNADHRENVLRLTGLHGNDFKQMGLLNLLPEIREKMYEPFIAYFEEHNIPFSIADNDMHHIGTNRCCCGDRLITKSTDFNSTAMCKAYGKNYTKQQLDCELNSCGISGCKCNQVFTSNRLEGCTTVQEFYDKRFARKTSPFSPKFLVPDFDGKYLA